MQSQNNQSLIKELRSLLSDSQVKQNVNQQLNSRALKLLKCYDNKQKNNSSAQNLIKGMNRTKSKPKQMKNNQSTKKVSLLNYTVTCSKSDLKNKSTKKINLKQMLDNSIESKQRSVNKSNQNRNCQLKNGKINRQTSNSNSKEKYGSKSKKMILRTEPNQNYAQKNQSQQYSAFNLEQCSNFQIQNQYQSAQLEIVRLIQQKQIATKQQRKFLQERATDLRGLIEQEKSRIADINDRTKLMQSQLNKISQTNQVSNTTFHVDRKKLETLFTDVKMIHQSLIDTNEQNQQVIGSLQEERQLINMYKTVIDQLKSQMKIQREQYDSIKKSLLILKKNELVARTKYFSTSGSSNGLLENLKDSINRWRI